MLPHFIWKCLILYFIYAVFHLYVPRPYSWLQVMNGELLSPGYMTSSDVHLTHEPYRKPFSITWGLNILDERWCGHERSQNTGRDKISEGKSPQIKKSGTMVWSHHRPVVGTGHCFIIKQVNISKLNPAPGDCVSNKERSVWFKTNTNQPAQKNCFTKTPSLCDRLHRTFSLWSDNGRTVGRRRKQFQPAVAKRIVDPRGVGGQG